MTKGGQSWLQAIRGGMRAMKYVNAAAITAPPAHGKELKKMLVTRINTSKMSIFQLGFIRWITVVPGTYTDSGILVLRRVIGGGFLEWPLRHEISVKIDDLLGSAIGSNLVVIDADDTVEIREEFQIVSNDDELLVKLRELALDAVAIAEIKQRRWFIGDDENRVDDQHCG